MKGKGREREEMYTYHLSKNSKWRKCHFREGFRGISIFIFAVDYFLDLGVRRLGPEGFDGCHCFSLGVLEVN